MTGHIFDIDVLLTTDSKPWIINKNNPSEPLIKLSKSDFNLIRNGVYKSQGNKIEFNDRTYWLPTNLFNKLKVIAKNKKIGIDDMAISLREFLNSDIIKDIKYDINYDSIAHLKNKNEDIYLVCSHNTERNFKSVIDKLIEELTEEGIKIKNFYYINETFSNVNSDEVIFKKTLLCLQHLVGYKSKNDKFIDESITKYDKLYFYDDNFDTLKMTDEINSALKIILFKTDEGLKDVIKEDINDSKGELIVNKITSNKYNKFTTSNVKISLSNIITFENFKFK